MKVQDILDTFDFTMDEFWEVVDALPEDDLPEHAHGKRLKKNVKAYFKKDGTLKAKGLSLSTQNDYQTMHDTQGFIRRYVRNNIHMNRQKKRVQDKLDNRGKSPKITDEPENDQTIQLSSVAIRNRLAEEYNRLIREGNPETKESREQIHVEIRKLEETIASNT